VTDALGQVSTSLYDKADRLTETVDARGNHVLYSYDTATACSPGGSIRRAETSPPPTLTTPRGRRRASPTRGASSPRRSST